MSDDLDLTAGDIAFFEVLTNGIRTDVGHGQMTSWMSHARARELWKAGYIHAAPHDFGSGAMTWPGLRYTIDQKGIDKLRELGSPNVAAHPRPRVPGGRAATR